MLRVAEVAKTSPESPASYIVPSTSFRLRSKQALRLDSGQALRELDGIRWLSEVEAKTSPEKSWAICSNMLKIN